ncbi:AAA family ATPase [Rhodobacter sp. CZR27]|uniref:AAA family ATPase n=1 Tax=Rhodobacter sp. CZR27 TaxID=2033869 RepID=UPI0018E07D37|nr:AAA family ATPase [Rhodobacter sp. CZR27]
MTQPVLPVTLPFPSPQIAEVFAVHLALDPPLPEELPELGAPDPEDRPRFGRLASDPEPPTAALAAPRDSGAGLRAVSRREAVTLLMLAGLAATLAEIDIARLFRPGTLTLLRPPAPGFEKPLEEAVTLRLLRHLRARAGLPEDEAPDPKLRSFAAKGGTSPRDTATEKRRFREQLAGLVEAGHPLILVTAEPDLPDGDLAALANLTLQLPRLSPDLVLEVLSRTHRGSFEEAEVRARLPDREALARLGALQITAAFALAEATEVADRLSEIAHAGLEVPRVTLDDLQGQPEAVTVLRRMAADLAAWRAGSLPWSQVTASALLAGPPGVGKTMAAEALAGSAGVPLIATSYSACQKMGHQGDALAELNARVEEAIGRAPSVFFIDEVDSYETRGGTDHSSKYQRGIVNGLLEQLSRLALAEGVIVIAATNFPEIVDPAVTRSGRLDLKVAMTLPDRQGLEDLLRAELARLGAVPEIAVEAITALARRLVGCSGADVAALVRDAAGRARAAGRGLTAADLAASAERLSPPADPAFERRAALHEAGHLVVGHLTDLPPATLARLTPHGGLVERPFLPVYTLPTAKARLACLMAGRVAERLVLGAPSSGAGAGPASDLAQATRLALDMETAWRLAEDDGERSGGLSWHDPDRVDLRADPTLRARVEARLGAAEAEATRLIRGHLDDLQRMAAALLRERELDAGRIAEVLTPLARRAPDDETASPAIRPSKPDGTGRTARPDAPPLHPEVGGRIAPPDVPPLAPPDGGEVLRVPASIGNQAPEGSA